MLSLTTWAELLLAVALSAWLLAWLLRDAGRLSCRRGAFRGGPLRHETPTTPDHVPHAWTRELAGALSATKPHTRQEHWD